MKKPYQLYPQAKTLEQKLKEDKIRQERYRRLLPKFAWIGVPVIGSLLFAGVVSFVYSLPMFWAAGNQAMVFFSFAIWIGVAGCVIAWVFYVNASLYAYAASRSFFWIGYIAVGTLLLVLFGYGVLPAMNPWVSIGIFTLIHFVLIGILSSLLFFMNRSYPSGER